MANKYGLEQGPVTLIAKIKQQPFKEWQNDTEQNIGYQPRWFLLDAGDVQWSGDKYLDVNLTEQDTPDLTEKDPDGNSTGISLVTQIDRLLLKLNSSAEEISKSYLPLTGSESSNGDHAMRGNIWMDGADESGNRLHSIYGLHEISFNYDTDGETDFIPVYRYIRLTADEDNPENPRLSIDLSNDNVVEFASNKETGNNGANKNIVNTFNFDKHITFVADDTSNEFTINDTGRASFTYIFPDAIQGSSETKGTVALLEQIKYDYYDKTYIDTFKANLNEELEKEITRAKKAENLLATFTGGSISGTAEDGSDYTFTNPTTTKLTTNSSADFVLTTGTGRITATENETVDYKTKQNEQDLAIVQNATDIAAVAKSNKDMDDYLKNWIGANATESANNPYNLAYGYDATAKGYITQQLGQDKLIKNAETIATNAYNLALQKNKSYTYATYDEMREDLAGDNIKQDPDLDNPDLPTPSPDSNIIKPVGYELLIAANDVPDFWIYADDIPENFDIDDESTYPEKYKELFGYIKELPEDYDPNDETGHYSPSGIYRIGVYLISESASKTDLSDYYNKSDINTGFKKLIGTETDITDITGDTGFDLNLKNINDYLYSNRVFQVIENNITEDSSTLFNGVSYQQVNPDNTTAVSGILYNITDFSEDTTPTVQLFIKSDTADKSIYIRKGYALDSAWFKLSSSEDNDDKYVNVTGDTMTGTLLFSGLSGTSIALDLGNYTIDNVSSINFTDSLNITSAGNIIDITLDSSDKIKFSGADSSEFTLDFNQVTAGSNYELSTIPENINTNYNPPIDLSPNPVIPGSNPEKRRYDPNNTSSSFNIGRITTSGWVNRYFVTRKEEVDDITSLKLDFCSVLWEPFAFASMSITNIRDDAGTAISGTTVEIGRTITSCTLNWSYNSDFLGYYDNKKYGNNFYVQNSSDGIGLISSITPSSAAAGFTGTINGDYRNTTSTNVSFTGITSDTSFTLTANAINSPEPASTDASTGLYTFNRGNYTKSASIVFRRAMYYGRAKDANTSYTSIDNPTSLAELINSSNMSKSLKMNPTTPDDSSLNGTYNFTGTASEYIYFCVPSGANVKLTETSFVNNGQKGGFIKITPEGGVSYTNSYDSSANYEVWRSANKVSFPISITIAA